MFNRQTLEKIINSGKRIVEISLLAGAFAVNPFLENANVREFNKSNQKVLQGICYSPFREGQDPNLGIFPREDEIQEDLSIISSITSNIRTYGNDNILYEIPRLCDEAEINCHIGAWISGNKSANEQAVQNLIQIANQGYNTLKGLIVGSEVLLRGDISEVKLIEYLSQLNEATDIPVTTAETWSKYLEHPNIVEEVDYILIHVHPYWEGISVDEAPEYIIDRWNQVKQAYPGKEVIIGEIGWPTAGNIIGEAFPSEENQKKFLKEFCQLAKENDAKYFYFASFDESWKAKYEGEVGAHWGLYYADRTLKPALKDMLSKIVFTESDSDLWIVNPDGSGLKKLFGGVDWGGRVRFSPDGEYITFKGKDGKHRIIDLEGNVLQEFDGGGRSGRDFVWSPDGKSIIFGVYFDGIYRYSLQDSTLQQIATSPHRTYNHNPVMSPDLERIVFTHHEYGSDYYIYMLDVDGGNKELITYGTGTSALTHK